MNNDTTSIHDVDFTAVPNGVTLTNNPSTNTNKWTAANDGFPNSTYEFTLTTAGTYTFFCDYHSWMTGTITVT
ncbi:MAG: plastocyanin/azurin family copper-binding protein [Thaumarchaeota archaeon]|nr:plastocyanin/azurin family copper-binding protein [Nitrososphaerota archaeon]